MLLPGEGIVVTDDDAHTTAAEVAGRLAPGQLSRRCTLDALTFETTDQLGDDAQAFGQQRAIDAIAFGIGIRDEGYNLFAMGSVLPFRTALLNCRPT
mgnify:CR=1 FL=1